MKSWLKLSIVLYNWLNDLSLDFCVPNIFKWEIKLNSYFKEIANFEA